LRPGIRVEDGIEVRRYEPSHWFARGPMLKLFSFVPVPAWQCLTQTCNPVALRMLYDAARFDGPCDAIHATALPYGWPLICGLKLARCKKAQFLLTPFLHFGDPTNLRDRTRKAYTSKAMRYLLASADTIFVQTELEGETIRQIGIPFDRIVFQGMGVDPAECAGGNRERTRQKWGIHDECVIGHLANLSRAKGTIDLLRAARLAWEAGARFRIILAGAEMPDFRRVWQDFEPKDRVWLLGPLDEMGKKDFFAAIDAFCLPSRTDSFGLVILEAWANGKPVIAYRAGGVAELIHDGVDGRLINCGDRNGLADALKLVERDVEVRSAWGASGQARINCEFRWDDKLRIVENALTARRVSKGGLARASG
jgi:glycosyltransferase involved in cell wall biosynthesis